MRTLRDTYGVPGIAMSGYDDDEHARHAASAGICPHLCKPIQFEQLLDAIEKCRPVVRQPA